ncbi:hypothetical protein RJT34_17172 [Clitoria ternatea]|uniref:Uncharacterized protein n=1 Tax=Clitoria ternatea TaxID=43366 RepID=A0AAN9J8G4_CLITE
MIIPPGQGKDSRLYQTCSFQRSGGDHCLVVSSAQHFEVAIAETWLTSFIICCKMRGPVHVFTKNGDVRR